MDMTGTGPTIPVIFCIDVEPDPRLVNRFAPEPWLGYEFAQGYLEELRPRIEALTGAPAHYSWFLRMDPQVAESQGSSRFVTDRYANHLSQVEKQGDEIGIHLHAWRWLPTEATWMQDWADQPWVEHCLRMALEAFATALGRRCQSLRMGDRWLNTETVALAEELGVRYDLTVEPGRPESTTPNDGELGSGRLPDYRRVPREPWVPSTVDFRRPAAEPSRNIVMIPLTSGYQELGLHPGRFVRRILGNGFRYRLQDTPLMMFKDWTAPNLFSTMLDRALSRQRRPYLAFAIRTDFGVVGPQLQFVKRSLRALLEHEAAPRFRFCTPPEALQILSGNL
jgi:hypothetical protein